MEETGKRKKVLCPVERNGKTVWRLLGSAFVNKDNSINVYLDSLPTNGKLQLRDWEDTDNRPGAHGQFNLRAVGGAPAPVPPVEEELPF